MTNYLLEVPLEVLEKIVQFLIPCSYLTPGSFNYVKNLAKTCKGINTALKKTTVRISLLIDVNKAEMPYLPDFVEACCFHSICFMVKNFDPEHINQTRNCNTQKLFLTHGQSLKSLIKAKFCVDQDEQLKEAMELISDVLSKLNRTEFFQLVMFQPSAEEAITDWRKFRVSFDKVTKLELFDDKDGRRNLCNLNQFLKLFPSLRFLFLNNVDFTTNDISHLHHLIGLKGNCLSSSLIEDQRVKPCFSLPNLEELVLFDSNAIIEIINFAQMFPKLHTFCFDYIAEPYSTMLNFDGVPASLKNLSISSVYLPCFANCTYLENLKIDINYYDPLILRFLTDSQRSLISVCLVFATAQSSKAMLQLCLEVLRSNPRLRILSIHFLNTEKQELQNIIKSWTNTNAAEINMFLNLLLFIFLDQYLVMKDAINVETINFVNYFDDNFEWQFRTRYSGTSSVVLPFKRTRLTLDI